VSPAQNAVPHFATAYREGGRPAATTATFNGPHDLPLLRRLVPRCARNDLTMSSRGAERGSNTRPMSLWSVPANYNQKWWLWPAICSICSKICSKYPPVGCGGATGVGPIGCLSRPVL